MGTGKPLVRIADRPLLEHVLEALSRSLVTQIVVVLGHEAALVKEEIPLADATVVVNREYAEGMSTSIRAGLRASDPQAAAFLLVLGDQPFVSSTTIDTLIRRWRPRRPRILIPTFRGRRGNPVLVDRSVSSEIRSISGDVGFRELFQNRADDILEVPVDDPGILVDVDTPEQLRSLSKEIERGRPLKEILTDLAIQARTASR